MDVSFNRQSLMCSNRVVISVHIAAVTLYRAGTELSTGALIVVQYAYHIVSYHICGVISRGIRNQSLGFLRGKNLVSHHRANIFQVYCQYFQV